MARIALSVRELPETSVGRQPTTDDRRSHREGQAVLGLLRRRRAVLVEPVGRVEGLDLDRFDHRRARAPWARRRCQRRIDRGLGPAADRIGLEIHLVDAPAADEIGPDPGDCLAGLDVRAGAPVNQAAASYAALRPHMAPQPEPSLSIVGWLMQPIIGGAARDIGEPSARRAALIETCAGAPRRRRRPRAFQSRSCAIRFQPWHVARCRRSPSSGRSIFWPTRRPRCRSASPRRSRARVAWRRRHASWSGHGRHGHRFRARDGQ